MFHPLSERPKVSESRTLPLDDVLVVSIEQAVAAPFATRQLADLGARVIKIERESGDFARKYDVSVDGEASYFVWLNRSKESVVLDLKDHEDLERLRKIIDLADVFVQNLAPGAAKRLGLGAEALTTRNSALIYVSISGYGEQGPLSQKKAYDLLIQCESGLLSVTGTPEEPAKVGISIADIAAGMYAYTGVLSALLNRAKTGIGDIIEVSMLEALGEWMQQPELYTRYGGTPPPRSGASHATIAPYGPFRAADGVVFFGIQNEREWYSFCGGVLQNTAIAQRPEFANNTLRVANRAALTEMIERKLAELNVADVTTLLDRAGIANAELRDMARFAEHPQLAARDRWIDVATPGGRIRSLRPPVTSRSQGLRITEVPALGAHTDAVLREFAQGPTSQEEQT
jgi:itaconate CoA-transferase